MRIKKIAASCKLHCQAILWDAVDADGVIKQWISSGAAVYPVDGMPYLQVEHLPTLLSLSNKDEEKMRLDQSEKPEAIDLHDAVDKEAIAEPAEFSILHLNRELLPIRVHDETYFIDAELLEPITAEYKNTEMWLRRTKDGTPYFAVKAGLMCVGIVMPMQYQQYLVDKLAEVAECYPGDPPMPEAKAEEPENNSEIEGQEEMS